MEKQKQLAPNYKWKNQGNTLNYDKEINNIKVEISNIKKDIENIDENLTSLQVQIVNNADLEKNHYNFLNSEIINIDNRVTQNTQNISDNLQQINAINRNLITIENRINNITDEIPFLKWLVDTEYLLQNMDGSDFTQLFEIPYYFTNIYVISTKISCSGNPVNMFANISDCGFTYNFVNTNNKNYIEVSYKNQNDKFNLRGSTIGFNVVYTQFLQS